MAFKVKYFIFLFRPYWLSVFFCGFKDAEEGFKFFFHLKYFESKDVSYHLIGINYEIVRFVWISLLISFPTP